MCLHEDYRLFFKCRTAIVDVVYLFARYTLPSCHSLYTNPDLCHPRSFTLAAILCSFIFLSKIFNSLELSLDLTHHSGPCQRLQCVLHRTRLVRSDRDASQLPPLSFPRPRRLPQRQTYHHRFLSDLATHVMLDCRTTRNWGRIPRRDIQHLCRQQREKLHPTWRRLHGVLRHHSLFFHQCEADDEQPRIHEIFLERTLQGLFWRARNEHYFENVVEKRPSLLSVRLASLIPYSQQTKFNLLCFSLVSL